MLGLARKQCSGIIKGWLYCLALESIGRLFVSDILMFGSALRLVMAQTQFSLIKKIKIGRPEHLRIQIGGIGTFLPPGLWITTFLPRGYFGLGGIRTSR